MALKTERILYVARNNDTGLVDVTATVRRNGTIVATAVALTEINSTDMPGVYELVISPAQITTWGGAGYFQFSINSASKNAPATVAKWFLENNEDDLESHLATLETKIDNIQTDITTIDGKADSIISDVSDTNTKINDPTIGLANLKALIDAIQSSVGSIQNNTRFIADMPSQLIRPGSGSTTYRIGMRFYDTEGNMEDPDSNAITVTITDEAGNSRASYLSGTLVRVGVGVYYHDIAIPDTADLEQLTFDFSLVENLIPLSYVRTSQVVEDIQASGLAQQATLVDVLTDTADMQPRVADIQVKINSATFGLSALKDLIDILDANVDANKATLEDASFGLANIKTVLDTKASQTSVNALQTDVTNNVKGAGFDQAEDTLHQLSLRTFYGGSAV